MAIRTLAPRSRATRSPLLASGIVAAALICAAVILARVSQTGRSSEAPKTMVVAEFNTVRIPVPMELVPAGTKLKDIKLQFVDFPKHQVSADAIIDIAPFMESASVAPLPANLPLFAQNFSQLAASGNPVIERIPQGMRAMTIQVDATSAVEGWAGSGAVVDVLLVEKDRTTVVAEKVQILSAERSVTPVDGQASPNVPKTVTLLVKQEQCLAINTAIPRGRIAFALRSFNDQQNWVDTIYKAEQLKGQPQVDPSQSITGYVEVKDLNKDQTNFALSGGKWIKTEAKPQGFLAAEDSLKK